MGLVKLILSEPVLVSSSNLFNSLFSFLFSQTLTISLLCSLKNWFSLSFLKIKTSAYLLPSGIFVLWIPEYNPQQFCDHMYNLGKEIIFLGLDTWITEHYFALGFSIQLQIA